MSEDLKGLKVSIKEANTQTKTSLTTLGSRVGLVEKGQEWIEARLLDKLSERMRKMLYSEEQDKSHSSYLLAEIEKSSVWLGAPRVDSKTDSREAGREFLKKVLTCENQ